MRRHAGVPVECRKLGPRDRQPQVCVSFGSHFREIGRKPLTQLGGFARPPGLAHRENQRWRQHVGPFALQIAELVEVLKTVVIERQQQPLVSGSDELAGEPADEPVRPPIVRSRACHADSVIGIFVRYGEGELRLHLEEASANFPVVQSRRYVEQA